MIFTGQLEHSGDVFFVKASLVKAPDRRFARVRGNINNHHFQGFFGYCGNGDPVLLLTDEVVNLLSLSIGDIVKVECDVMSIEIAEPAIPSALAAALFERNATLDPLRVDERRQILTAIREAGTGTVQDERVTAALRGCADVFVSRSDGFPEHRDP